MSIHTANTDRIIIQWYAYETILDALNEIYSAILTQLCYKKGSCMCQKHMWLKSKCSCIEIKIEPLH